MATEYQVKCKQCNGQYPLEWTRCTMTEGGWTVYACFVCGNELWRTYIGGDWDDSPYRDAPQTDMPNCKIETWTWEQAMQSNDQAVS